MKYQMSYLILYLIHRLPKRTEFYRRIPYLVFLVTCLSSSFPIDYSCSSQPRCSFTTSFPALSFGVLFVRVHSFDLCHATQCSSCSLEVVHAPAVPVPTCERSCIPHSPAMEGWQDDGGLLERRNRFRQ